jgi:hypothetical protein
MQGLPEGFLGRGWIQSLGWGWNQGQGWGWNRGPGVGLELGSGVGLGTVRGMGLGPGTGPGLFWAGHLDTAEHVPLHHMQPLPTLSHDCLLGHLHDLPQLCLRPA